MTESDLLKRSTSPIDFVQPKDASNEKSIEFLKRNGLDFHRIREQGVGAESFFSEFSQILKWNVIASWVTFHGSYDVAYLLKYLTGESSIPATLYRFSKSVKAIAGRYRGLSTRLGLESLSRELGVSRVGIAHLTGSDSDLTARVFVKMVCICDNVRECEGFVYRVECDKVLMISHRRHRGPTDPMHIHGVMMSNHHGPYR